MRTQVQEISHIGPRAVRPFVLDATDPNQVANLLQNLPLFGIGLDARDVQRMFEAHQAGMPMIGMDADLVQPQLTPSVNTPVQFLQAWLPGFVHTLTWPRKVDELIGITTMGRWEDEEVVQGILERTGTPAVYGDLTNIPLASWLTQFERRTIVRFEEGMTVGRLEEARAAAMRVSSADSKRSASAEALEIVRNFTGFFGYNDGSNRTYGMLNDPALVVNASGGVWTSAGYDLIIGEIRSWYAGIRVQSRGRIDPGKEMVTMGLPLSKYDFLSTINGFGNSVMQWINETYPNTRIVAVPEFDTAVAGDTLAMLFAEGVVDDSTDDGRTWVQVVPSKFQTLGVQQMPKQYIEDYSNATAGVFLKRPYGVYAVTGI